MKEIELKLENPIDTNPYTIFEASGIVLVSDFDSLPDPRIHKPIFEKMASITSNVAYFDICDFTMEGGEAEPEYIENRVEYDGVDAIYKFKKKYLFNIGNVGDYPSFIDSMDDDDYIRFVILGKTVDEYELVVVKILEEGQNMTSDVRDGLEFRLISIGAINTMYSSVISTTTPSTTTVPLSVKPSISPTPEPVPTRVEVTGPLTDKLSNFIEKFDSDPFYIDIDNDILQRCHDHMSSLKSNGLILDYQIRSNQVAYKTCEFTDDYILAHTVVDFLMDSEEVGGELRNYRTSICTKIETETGEIGIPYMNLIDKKFITVKLKDDKLFLLYQINNNTVGDVTALPIIEEVVKNLAYSYGYEINRNGVLTPYSKSRPLDICKELNIKMSDYYYEVKNGNIIVVDENGEVIIVEDVESPEIKLITNLIEKATPLKRQYDSYEFMFSDENGSDWLTDETLSDVLLENGLYTLAHKKEKDGDELVDVIMFLGKMSEDSSGYL